MGRRRDRGADARAEGTPGATHRRHRLLQLKKVLVDATEELAAQGKTAQAWMLEQRGATEKIVKVLEEAVQL